MSQVAVYETLERYHITSEFFGRYFGRRVIDYSFGVISGRNELGNCPIIGVMLVFFQKKNFAIDDIFLLCVELKNTFLQYSLKHKVLTHNIMQEITHLMDQNLKGVIRDFIDMNHGSHPQSQTCSISYNTEISSGTVATTSALHYLQEIEVDFELLDELNEIEI
ncbi:MAG TPA: hypothetical protein VFX66_01125, partial [Sulfuricurvum sp.]|nr:hypothetical protein [Sulfuricurvum sp.]